MGRWLPPNEFVLLGAVIERPDSGGVVLIGGLSLSRQPWLADHVVGGAVLGFIASVELYYPEFLAEFPFLSYGGSSMITDCFLLALVNSIGKRSQG